MPDLTFLAIAGTAMLVGAAVQSSVGLGLGLIAAPVVALLDPTLVPGAVLVATCALPALTLLAEWRHIDLSGVVWALGGRLVGTVVGVWVVAVLAPSMLAVAVGVMVLVAVVLTIRTIAVRPAPTALTIAGLVSGVTGTATSISGPPIALLYQHEKGPRVRSTLSGYFLVGVAVSLLALALGGQLEPREVGVGLSLLPFVLVGFALSRTLRRFVVERYLRTALLVVVSVSGVALILQGFR